MKTLSDNFFSFVMLLILAVSPVQNALASASHMTMMKNAMQQEVSVSSDSNMQGEHCKGHQSNLCKCDISHCTNVSFIILPTTIKSDLNFTHTNYALRSDSEFIQPLKSSLFRPPRV